MGILDGKVAIVTGAGQGLGRVEALELARNGASVVVNDLGTGADGSGSSEEPARSVVQEIEALGVIEITARVGSEGKLFGSIGVGDVCDAIEALGGDVQKSEVRMPEGALRLIGEHIVDIHLYTDIDTQVTINIIGEE